MNVVHGIENYVFSSKSILTIGTFDGVHLGHQKIIQKLVKKARDQKLQANLLTFFPHPRMVLQKEASIRLIDTLAEKEQLLRKLGIDNLIIHPFTKEFSKLSAVEFTRDVLVNQLGINSLFIGYDHRFGKNREATVEDLISYGKTYNFQVTIIPAQDIASITVSSTKIRNAILKGETNRVAKFLGEPYELYGRVVKGQALGRIIGFPTANIDIESDIKLLPKAGVYAVNVLLPDGSIREGMMNIGTKPTIATAISISLEVHLFDFDQDIYGKYITVQFLSRFRDEEKFNSVFDLREQLSKDEVSIRTYFSDGL